MRICARFHESQEISLFLGLPVNRAQMRTIFPQPDILGAESGFLKTFLDFPLDQESSMVAMNQRESFAFVKLACTPERNVYFQISAKSCANAHDCQGNSIFNAQIQEPWRRQQAFEQDL